MSYIKFTVKIHSYIKFTIIIRHKDPRDYRKYSLILHYTYWSLKLKSL